MTLDDLKGSLAARLPERAAAAVAAYDAFSATPAPDDAKGFAAHHAACKAALGHAEMLVKLLKWSEGEAAPAEGADGDLGTLLARARQALGPDEEDMEDDDSE